MRDKIKIRRALKLAEDAFEYLIITIVFAILSVILLVVMRHIHNVFYEVIALLLTISCVTIFIIFLACALVTIYNILRTLRK